ncbi:MAG: arylsulfatase A-like enzyme, partial [Akkermansiaceae bacterium]
MIKSPLLTLLACLGFFLLSNLGFAAPRPNIILILADDLGYADTGFNNSPTAKTPHLDRFVKSGVKLTDFRACPMCSPTRAGMLTGRWPLRFGMMRAVIPPWSKYGLPAE